MTCVPNVIQKSNSNPEIFPFEGTNTAAILLISYLRKLRLQKIFRLLSMTLGREKPFIP
jgi:hypothetical protein